MKSLNLLNIDSVNKIMIFGCPGGGKSTFALKLHQLTQLPLYHLDKFFYTKNWQERTYLEFLKMQSYLVNQSRWIIDGNNTKSFELRYQSADLVLFFNLPLHICFYRVFKRLVFKNKAIDDRAPGCHETVRWQLLKYMWGFERRIERQIQLLRIKYLKTQFIEFNRDEEVDYFLRHLTI